jgi:ATP-binding cassette subfamily F protein uup
MRSWYDEKERHEKNKLDEQAKQPKVESKLEKAHTSASTRSNKKLSYKDSKELEEFPKKIERMEKELEELQLVISANDFFQQEEELTQVTLQKLTNTEKDLSVAYARWDELESLQNNEQ